VQQKNCRVKNWTWRIEDSIYVRVPFSIYHTVYARIFKIWRRKRFELFVQLVSPKSDQRLLDVGGSPAFWTEHPVMFGQVDVLNIHPFVWEEQPEYHIQTCVGDGCSLQFADKNYDLVFSNSVIEHVGSWERQQAFAKEMRRVGKSVWVQTPAFECPIEPHYLAPFVHWLPKSIRGTIIRWLTPRGWLGKLSPKEVAEMVETTRLLTKREMRILFPDCEIYTERLLGVIPKSYIALRKSTGVAQR
jgi:hypothetical protein